MRGRRVSPATAIALVALFFSLGGVGMAVAGSAGNRPYLVTAYVRVSPPHRFGTAIARCRVGDHASAGGFQGLSNAVLISDLPYPFTGDDPKVRYVPTGWGAVVSFPPRAVDFGSVYAWALCS